MGSWLEQLKKPETVRDFYLLFLHQYEQEKPELFQQPHLQEFQKELRSDRMRELVEDGRLEEFNRLPKLERSLLLMETDTPLKVLEKREAVETLIQAMDSTPRGQEIAGYVKENMAKWSSSLSLSAKAVEEYANKVGGTQMEKDQIAFGLYDKAIKDIHTIPASPKRSIVSDISASPAEKTSASRWDLPSPIRSISPATQPKAPEAMVAPTNGISPSAASTLAILGGRLKIAMAPDRKPGMLDEFERGIVEHQSKPKTPGQETPKFDGPSWPGM